MRLEWDVISINGIWGRIYGYNGITTVELDIYPTIGTICNGRYITVQLMDIGIS